MSTFNDTRHVIHGATGGSNDDTSAYNDVVAAGSTITFTTINGDQKSVSVTGGAGGSVQAFNGATLDTTTNDVTFTSTTGNAAHAVTLPLTPITDLQTLTNSHVGSIQALQTLTGTGTSGHSTLIAQNTTDIATNDSNITTLTNQGLKSIEIDGNGDLRGKRYDGSYTGKIENLNDALLSASIAATAPTGNEITFSQISGQNTSITVPNDAITINFTVQSTAGGSKYFYNNVQGSTLPLELLAGHKYIFNYPAAHPLRLSRTPDGGSRDGAGVSLGSDEHTNGVTTTSPDGTNQTQTIFLNTEVITDENLYYYCHNHPNMGGTIIDDNGVNNITDITYNSSVPRLEITRANGSNNVNLSDSFTNATIVGTDLQLQRASTTNTLSVPLPSNYYTNIQLDPSDSSILQVTKSGTTTDINLPSGGSSGGTTTDHPTAALTSNTSLANYTVSADENSANAWKAFDDSASNHWETADYAGVDGTGFNVINTNLWTGLGSPSSGSTTYNSVVYQYKNYSPAVTTTVALENGFTLNMTNLHHANEYANGAYWNGNSPGQWYIESLVAGATYQYELYSCQIKTDHHYAVGVNVTGSSTNSHTYTQSATTSVVVTDTINADTNGKIFFSLSNVGLYGAGLSWIRLRAQNYNSSGTFTGTSSLSLSSGTVDGTWLKIQIPNSENLSSLNIAELTTNATVDDFSVLGSSDDTTWTTLLSETGAYVNNIATGGTDYPISAAGNFHYFAIVFESIKAAASPKRIKVTDVTFTTSTAGGGGGSSFQNSLLNGLGLFSGASYVSNTTPPRLELAAYGSGTITNVDFPQYQTLSDIQTAGYKTLTEIQALNYETIASLTTAGYKTASATMTDVAAVGYQTLATLTTNGYKTVADTLTDVATDHYTKPEVDSLLPKGVWAESSVVYTPNSSSTWSLSQLAVSGVGGTHTASVNSGSQSTTHYPTLHIGWASQPEAHYIDHTHYFSSPYRDDTGELSSEYKVVLTKTKINTFDIFVVQKDPNYCRVGVHNAVNPSNYYFLEYGYDFMVF